VRFSRNQFEGWITESLAFVESTISFCFAMLPPKACVVSPEFGSDSPTNGIANEGLGDWESSHGWGELLNFSSSWKSRGKDVIG